MLRLGDFLTAAAAAASGTSWVQIAVAAVAIAVTATVSFRVAARARRDRRDEALSTEERSSALEVNELIAAAEVPKATSYDGPVSGCSGPVASYDEWLQQWDRRSASLLPRLPPAIRARLELLSHLLERSSKVGGGPFYWSLAIRYGVADLQRAVTAAIGREAPQARPGLPEKNVIDDLMTRGVTLGTTDQPLVDEIIRAGVEHMAQGIGEAARSARRRYMRLGVVLGVSLTVLVVNVYVLVHDLLR